MVYLDHAASTPVLPEAIEAMTAQLRVPGNASSAHASGRRARRVVEESRETVARALGARPSEVVFTSGGTEADNLAIKGIFWSRHDVDPRRRRIVLSAVEHHAVLDAALWLEQHENAVLSWLPVDAAGRIDPEDVRRVLTEHPAEVALVSVMWANNELGTVQPIRAVAAICREFEVPMHTDAVQAVGQVPVSFQDSGVGALSITGHKIGGPVGVGALLLRGDLACTPLLHGGGQERDVRSGTLDTAGVAGFAVAADQATSGLPERARMLQQLRDRLVSDVLAAVPDAVLNGDQSLAPDRRLPGNAHLSFPGCEGDSLLLLLDAQDIACSTGSACSAGVSRPSHVLVAAGVPDELARGSLRFSLGSTSTAADAEALAQAIGPVVERARRAALAGARLG